MRSWIRAGWLVPPGGLTQGLVHISRSAVPSRGDNLNQRGYIIAWRHVITSRATTSSFQNPLIYSSHLVRCFACSYALSLSLSRLLSLTFSSLSSAEPTPKRYPFATWHSAHFSKPKKISLRCIGTYSFFFLRNSRKVLKSEKKINVY